MMTTKDNICPTVLESPDGGKTVYSRKFGDPWHLRELRSKELSEAMNPAKLNRVKKWAEILEASENSVPLRNLIEQAELVYEIIRKEQ